MDLKSVRIFPVLRNQPPTASHIWHPTGAPQCPPYAPADTLKEFQALLRKLPYQKPLSPELNLCL